MIGFSIYNVSFFAVLIAVLYAANISDHQTVYGVASAFQILGTMITTFIMFGSKMLMVRTADKRSSSRGSGASSGRAALARAVAAHHSSTSTFDFTRLKDKYRNLKKMYKVACKKLAEVGVQAGENETDADFQPCRESFHSTGAVASDTPRNHGSINSTTV